MASHSNGNNYVNPYPYVYPQPAHVNGPTYGVWDMLDRCGKRIEHATRKAEVLADHVWQHLRVSPNLANAAMAKLAQGTKVLTEGGHEKVFQQEFQILPGEKLLKAYACYASTPSGPLIGTLYVSTKRMAFCSDYPYYYPSPGQGQPQRMYYKVVVQLDQLSAVSPSTNGLNPSDKYIHIVTKDGYEFWFMGFVSYDKALKTLTEALQRALES